MKALIVVVALTWLAHWSLIDKFEDAVVLAKQVQHLKTLRYECFGLGQRQNITIENGVALRECVDY